LEKWGDIRGAIVSYDRATEILPSLTEAWFRAGALVYTLGHRNEAIDCFRQAAWCTSYLRSKLRQSPNRTQA
jgi:tetratricopeptide (TPR) repeat protein